MPSQSSPRVSLSLVALGVAACTFPMVDYATEGAGGSSGTTMSNTGTGGADAGPDAPLPCDVPKKCGNEANSCGEKARGGAKSCANKCKPGDPPDCKAACDDQLTTDLAGCVMACVGCAADRGCSTQDTPCADLVSM
ncbi:MAG: hypothetical protein ABI193_07155 [Minicystis sp.]